MRDPYGRGTPEWRAAMRYVVQRDGYCRLRLPGCRVVAQTADHIVPLARGGALLDLANLQGACVPCNMRKGAGPRRPMRPGPHQAPRVRSQDW